MPYVVQMCDQTMMLDILNGARVLGPFSASGVPAGGKTLVFQEPAATVTFPGEEGSSVSFKDIVGALKEQLPDAQVVPRRLRHAHDRPDAEAHTISVSRDAGFSVAPSGTANALFGFSTDEATQVKGALPRAVVQSIAMPSPGLFLLILAPEE